MRRLASGSVVVAACAAVVLGAAGCNRNDSPVMDAGPATPTTAVNAPQTSAAPTPTTLANGPAKSPEFAAQGLFERWKAGDRAGASRYGRQRAIDELFKHPNTGDVAYADQGCRPQGGQFLCSWTYPGGVLEMTVEDVAGGGFVVDLVAYAAD